MVELRRLFPGARRRRKPRVDAPKTIVPPREGTGRPTDAPAADSTPAAVRFDAARDRLRREIPPPPED